MQLPKSHTAGLQQTGMGGGGAAGEGIQFTEACVSLVRKPVQGACVLEECFLRRVDPFAASGPGRHVVLF